MNKRAIFSSSKHSLQVSNTYRIPTSSGIRLGATICRPTSEGKFPGLIWLDPYRGQSNGEASPMAEYFARRGYAFVYLSSRGTGNSEGISRDEYMVEETQDACDAIAWLSRQPWSSGKVGMLGASYSGFTALQAAVMAPPALKAIAPAYFSDRRYTDDCHYKGGCLRGYYDMLHYGLLMVSMNALPPFPSAVGEEWTVLWKQRLEKNEPYLLEWLRHQTEDEYWAQGSVFGQCHEIQAASMLIGGWNDGYVNPPLRVFDALQSPKKLLMGPWSHTYPDASHCGPRIDIYFELLRWWDRWLKEMDNGIEEEPPVQVYVREFEEPLTDRSTISGTWRMAERLPPSPSQTWHLNSSSLSALPQKTSGAASVRYLPAASRNGGLWDGGSSFCLPGAQNGDEGNAVNFTSSPLQSDLHIFGNVVFTLYISADVAVIPIAIRLTEVGADGTSVLVTKGIINASRRHGMDKPQPLVPGEITMVEYHFEATAWKFTKGNRLRISVNSSDFPNVWPTPLPGVLTLHWGPAHPSCVTLPVWDGGSEAAFRFSPSSEPPVATGTGTAPWQVTHDVLEDQYRFCPGPEMEFGVSQRTPGVAWARAKKNLLTQWPGCHIRAEATGALTSDEETFSINITLNVYLNEGLMFQRHWSDSVKRQLL